MLNDVSVEMLFNIYCATIMVIKKFGDKKITIRKLEESDLRNAKKFQIFINSLIDEEVKILINKKNSLKEEKDYLKRTIAAIKRGSKVFLLAEHGNKVVGSTDIELEPWRRNHIGEFGIIISKEYRGLGLGEYLMSEVIKLAKKELCPKPRIIQLAAYANNKPAISLYKKMGFKIIAKIPKQIQYKGALISDLVMIRDI